MVVAGSLKGRCAVGAGPLHGRCSGLQSRCRVVAGLLQGHCLVVFAGALQGRCNVVVGSSQTRRRLQGHCKVDAVYVRFMKGALQG